MNTARVRWVRQGVNDYGVGLVLESGTWLGDDYEAGDYVAIPPTMVPGIDYIDRDRTTSAQAPKKSSMLILAGSLALLLVLVLRRRSRR